MNEIMDTSATANNAGNNNASTQQQKKNDLFKMTAQSAKGFGEAIGSLIPTGALASLTTRKYALPDKSVASQVLMYRQLLHTKCRPGLKLARPYQATVAQKAVKHMPWWEEGIEQTEKMTISYDNLITRLWLNGAIEPYNTTVSEDDAIDTYMTEEGLPPVPHTFWVERLGFQQQDPVTDFRSGGVLSLAMMVYMVESCPKVCQRLFTGDASVLPFGITCINVTDMIAKFLMLAKSTDRMDALLSQKPFWKMFADPNAILAVQELAMTLLCDVVVELSKERKVPSLAKQHSSNMHGDTSTEVSVFDFALITERTEARVRDDLLGAGPKTVDELKAIAVRLRQKYQTQLDRRIQRALELEEQRKQQASKNAGSGGGGGGGGGGAAAAFHPIAGMANGLAGGLLSKMKKPVSPSNIFSGLGKNKSSPVPSQEPEVPAAVADFATPPDNTVEESDADWINDEIAPATEGFNNFSIGDDDDEDLL